MWSFVCCVENHNIIAKITSAVIEEEIGNCETISKT